MQSGNRQPMERILKEKGVDLMTENKRFKAHIFDDGVNERYHDGIIDMEKDGDVIVNYQFISNLLNELNDENEELKEILGAILLEVKRDITNTNQTGEIKVFINPNSFELISGVLRKYGALKGWYE